MNGRKKRNRHLNISRTKTKREHKFKAVSAVSLPIGRADYLETATRHSAEKRSGRKERQKAEKVTRPAVRGTLRGRKVAHNRATSIQGGGRDRKAGRTERDIILDPREVCAERTRKKR